MKETVKAAPRIDFAVVETLPELNLNDYGPSSIRGNAAFLLALLLTTVAGIAIPQTRDLFRTILAENNIVEVLTFILALVSAGVGASLALVLFKHPGRLIYAGFFGLFALALAFIGFEEISWGQQFFGFATPESFASMNAQGETTIHNINGMSGNTEYLRLLYGAGGIAGVFALNFKSFAKIGAPLFLLPWFVVITGHSIVDVFNDIVPIQRHFDALVSELAELMELLIVGSAGVYLLHKLRRLEAIKGDSDG